MANNHDSGPPDGDTEGWVRKNVASEPLLGETVEMYRELGYEVRLVPLLDQRATEGGEGSCTACYSGEDPARYQIIYVRKSGS